jgi:hypothetical protein
MFIAYRVSADAPRPLTFVWNGSQVRTPLLHFEAAGPSGSSGALVDNADTWLATMDLVFVDPIGTGFSRPAKPEYVEEFYGTVGDVATVTEFVRAWRLLHAAEDAPVLLAYESWVRAARQRRLCAHRRGIRCRLVLISGGTGLNRGPAPGLAPPAGVDRSTPPCTTAPGGRTGDMTAVRRRQNLGAKRTHRRWSGSIP